MEPPVLTKSTFVEKFRGITFSLVMLFSAFFGSVYILLPISPILFFKPKLFRHLIDRLIGFWLIMPSGLMEYMFGVFIFVSGDFIDRNKPSLIIMNHRTRLDWLFFWNALFRIDPWLLTTEKITLKGILKHVPGWAMASNAFLFLDRIFAKDKSRIDTLIEYYADSNKKYQLLLFPEGTDKCPIATARSRQFADKNNLVQYNYVLHPRTTGFIYLLQKMRKTNYVDYVYDVTCAYSDAIVQTEIDLVTLGVTPKKVHFDIRKFHISELPETDQGLDEWVKNLWAEKEERLYQYYTQLQKDSKHRLDTLPNATKDFLLSNRSAFIQKFVVVFWIILTVAWIVFFFTYPYQIYIVIATFIFYIGSQQIFGGIEMLMSLQLKQKTNKWLNLNETNEPKIKNSNSKMLVGNNLDKSDNERKSSLIRRTTSSNNSIASTSSDITSDIGFEVLDMKSNNEN